mmetsp:Transcript_44405/g.135364  ORF Transcript_44405/g.135364 Transcript_44405/m.135364 type:complete len:175 (-) Transcript_44405:25-549(-)
MCVMKKAFVGAAFASKLLEHSVTAFLQPSARPIVQSCLLPPNGQVVDFQRTRFISREHLGQAWSLFAADESRRMDPEYRNEVLAASEKRGNILFAISLLVVIWSFSIPVDLRRTHWCITDACVQDRSACLDCLTFLEWGGKVAEFYQTTDINDWVHFDFTVDPNFYDNFHAVMN